jgi:hypothetical protein
VKLLSFIHWKIELDVDWMMKRSWFEIILALRTIPSYPFTLLRALAVEWRCRSPIESVETLSAEVRANCAGLCVRFVNTPPTSLLLPVVTSACPSLTAVRISDLLTLDLNSSPLILKCDPAWWKLLIAEIELSWPSSGALALTWVGSDKRSSRDVEILPRFAKLFVLVAEASP